MKSAGEFERANVNDVQSNENDIPVTGGRRQKMFAVLPTLMALANAACGFGAITFAAKVGPEAVAGNEFFIAALLIYLAMVCDMLDGSLARLTNQTSEFGAQLDSLCDAVSFGAAPAFLMLRFMQHGQLLATELVPPFQYHPRLLWAVAVLFVICVLLRLARFNVETEEDDSHEGFSGLPSPAAAGAVAAFPIAMHGLNDLLAEGADMASRTLAGWLVPGLMVVLPLVTFAVACLMVSRVPYPHVFNQVFRGQRSRQHVIQLVFTLAVVLTVGEMAVPLIFCWFAFAAPAGLLWDEARGRRLYNRPGV